MFSFFRWNAQAQIPPRDSFTQKYRFAFGKQLASHAACACPARGLLSVCPVQEGCACVLGTGLAGAGAVQLGCCGSLLSTRSRSARPGAGGATSAGALNALPAQRPSPCSCCPAQVPSIEEFIPTQECIFLCCSSFICKSLLSVPAGAVMSTFCSCWVSQ